MICGKFLSALQRRACSNQPNEIIHGHGDNIHPRIRHVLDTKHNKGLGFSIEERQRLGVHGLYPCAVRSMEQQVESALINLRSRVTMISRYRYLRALRQRHERLYFRFIAECIEEVLPVIYTPTVGVACTTFSMIFRNPLGLFINRYDRGRIKDILVNWPEKDIRGVVVTDGERILGLGDLGANGMGISVGKLELYTALGNIPPNHLLAIALDVGTNNKELLNDPMYIGVREERLKGKEYEEFVDEFMEAITERYGRNCFIHFEDFATPNAFKFLKRYQNSYSFCNDDIQGTAATILSGFLTIEKVTKKPLTEHVVMFAGAGSACMGIMNLLIEELKNRDLEEDDIVENIYVVNEHGLFVKDTPNLSKDQARVAKDMPVVKTLSECIEKFKPSILVGASGVGGLFTAEILQNLAKFHEQPAILALSNPTEKAECTAEQAYKNTEGRAIFCSGSPFPPVVINGKRKIPGLANNCFIFPGIGVGAISACTHHIPDEVFLVAARTMAEFVSEDALESGCIYPFIRNAPDVAFNIGVAVTEYLVKVGLFNADYKPTNICESIKSQAYPITYGSAMLPTWPYPIDNTYEKKKKQKSI